MIDLEALREAIAYCNKHKSEMNGIYLTAEEANDILDMLEEQEALEKRCKALEVLEEQEQPKSVKEPLLCKNAPRAYKGFCPWCNSVITLIYGKFCDKCGKAVKWDAY